MSITFKENHIPDRDAFFQLYESTGWNEEYRLTAEEIYNCLSGSWYMVSAYDEGRLVGYGRILSDGKMHALITEMIVLPGYQGRGIGEGILKYLTGICLDHHIRDIQLFAAKGKVDFYEKYGYSKRPGDGPGMEIKYKP